jgi:hypothetical protein
MRITVRLTPDTTEMPSESARKVRTCVRNFYRDVPRVAAAGRAGIVVDTVQS